MKTLISESDHPVDLHLVPADQWASWLATRSDAEIRWLEQKLPTPSAGQSCTVANAAGDLSFAVVVLADVADVLALAQARSALTVADYRPVAWSEQSDVLALARGWALDGYRFERYLSSPSSPGARLIVNDKGLNIELAAIFTVRDLVNTPTEDLGPQQLAAAAKALADGSGGQCSVITGDDLLDQNYPAVHAVGRAATTPPCMIELSWIKADQPHLILVGKGVCYDTGGLNLKPGAGMRLMKKDMGGAAHVLGLAQWLVESGFPASLTVLIPAVENSVAGNAYRPGDVIPTRAGLSVEIGNTDAEGRVVLSDALTRAGELAPDLVIDFATLTGAARIALGPDLPALYARQDATSKAILDQGIAHHDPLWSMPLHQPYSEYLKSPIADISNMASTPMAGSVTAALFLDRFVAADLDWVHVDVYAWNPRTLPGHPEGGEAQGLRAMYHAIQQRFAR